MSNSPFSRGDVVRAIVFDDIFRSPHQRYVVTSAGWSQHAGWWIALEGLAGQFAARDFKEGAVVL